MNAEQKQRMEELIAEISKASYAYYVLDDPEVSDNEYDRLKAQYMAMLNRK